MEAKEETKSNELCTPCMTESSSIPASSFCHDCKEFLCLSCVKHHLKLTLTKDHQLVKITDKIFNMEEFTRIEERCFKHSGKIISMFCSLHEEIGCHKCMADNHAHCGEIVYIPERANGIKTSTELRFIIEDLDSIKDRLKALSNDRQLDLDRLGDLKDIFMTSLREIKQSIITRLEIIEDASIVTYHQKYQQNVTNIESDKTACNALSDSLEVIANIIKSTSEETPLFLQTIRAKRLISAGLKMVDSISRKVGNQQLLFSPDPRLEHLFNDIKLFGEIENVQRIYDATFVNKYDINVVSDREKTDVMMYGCAFIPDGRIIISDFSNKRLKVLNIEQKKTSYIDLSGSPTGVCNSGKNEAAVCLFDKCLVQFVTFTALAKPTRSFKTELNCQGIDFDGTHLFVTVTGNSSNQVRVYTITGSLQHIIEQNKRELFLSRINQIACCTYSENLYITDTKNGVFCLNKNGKVLGTTEEKDKTCIQPTGICPDGDGGFFVAGFKTNNIVHFGQNAVRVKTVLRDRDGIREPLSLSFDYRSLMLIVTLAGSKFLHVFKLHNTNHVN